MLNMINYTASDWFWVVGGDESRFYSSAARGYVSTLPEGWFRSIKEGEAAGIDYLTITAPTRIPTEDDLWDVLRRQAPECLPFDDVPLTVTPAQAKIALFEAGLLDTVETLIADYPYRPVSIWWANASAFERGNPYLHALGYELKLTDEQIDALFIAAGKK